MRKLRFSPFSMQFCLFSINLYYSDSSLCRAAKLCRALEDQWRPDTSHCPTAMNIPIPITSIQKKCLSLLNSLLRFIKDPQKYHFLDFLAVFRPHCSQKCLKGPHMELKTKVYVSARQSTKKTASFKNPIHFFYFLPLECFSRPIFDNFDPPL